MKFELFGFGLVIFNFQKLDIIVNFESLDVWVQELGTSTSVCPELFNVGVFELCLSVYFRVVGVFE